MFLLKKIPFIRAVSSDLVASMIWVLLWLGGNLAWSILRGEEPYIVFLTTLGALVGSVYLVTQGWPFLMRLRRQALEGEDLSAEIHKWLSRFKGVSLTNLDAPPEYLAMLEVKTKHDPVKQTGVDFTGWFLVSEKDDRGNKLVLMSALGIPRDSFDKVVAGESELRALQFQLSLEMGRYGAFYQAPRYEAQPDGSQSFVIKFWEPVRIDDTFGPSAIIDRIESIMRVSTLVQLILCEAYLEADVPMPTAEIAPPSNPSELVPDMAASQRQQAS